MTHLEALVAQYLGIKDLMFEFAVDQSGFLLRLAGALAKKELEIRREMGHKPRYVLMIGETEYELIRYMNKLQIKRIAAE
ncbi:hypothetical protein BWI93_27255 [Siphonobacter sp. BAB-5385]|uniref:hypothetical protein n=1 Tax=Siphonobacter sp. BAB-5385 TaxID=1864822 RepID=UPI000B9E17EF|nr:hypothetical protein [Siphonobacter sp. BAB-5385]OZI05087.1 hypothetical protein BWI93_27255 [Siphonobacter sp. BAB-5385]